MINDDGGPAFPVPNYINAYGESFISTPYGMSLRDYFAAQAMAGLLQRDGTAVACMGHKYGEDAYALADAMLKARSQ